MKQLLLLMAAVLLSATSFGQTEILLNGGFENWDDTSTPSDWDKVENSVQESSQVHSGTYSLKQIADGTKDIGQYVNVTAGNSYTISMWYYVESGDETDARIWSYWIDSNGSNVLDEDTDNALRGPGGSSSYFTSSASWQQYTTTVMAPELATQLYLEVRAYGSAVVYWDDFSIAETVATAIEDTEPAATATIYPNPFSSELTVAGSNVISSVLVINSVGQVVDNAYGNGSNEVTFSTGELGKGIYIIKCTDINGNITTEKVIKK
jgi:hypothetical protein